MRIRARSCWRIRPRCAVEFSRTQVVCDFNSKAREMVELYKALSFRMALAANALFLDVATHNRTCWTGCGHVRSCTTNKNFTHCNPNPNYYQDVLASLGLLTGACLMVFNNAYKDMNAETPDIRVSLPDRLPY